MPQISYFLGVIIRMFYRDHNPPHFHAVYANFEGIIDIEKNETEFQLKIKIEYEGIIANRTLG